MNEDQTNNTEIKKEGSAVASKAQFELSGRERPQNIRTYSSDIANTIKSGEASMVNIALSEHRRKEKDKEQISASSPKNKLFLAGGIALFILGLFVLGYFLYQALPKTVPIDRSDQVTVPTIVKIDEQKGIQITLFTREIIKESIARAYTESKPAIGKITGLFLFTVADTTNPKILGTEEFLNAIESSIPGVLKRSLDPNFTMGVYGGSNDGLFLVFKTNSYTNAFAGMLEWESSLFDEMYKIFKINIEGDNKKLFTTKFKDAVIRNQDARILENPTGENVLMYSFLGEDRGTLIITNSAETLEEVVSRLTASNLRR